MDVNLTLGVNSGSGRRGDRPGSLIRRRSSQHFVEPEFEPKIEWVETPEAHVLVADLPGFKKEDVKVQIDVWGNLIISGERRIQELVYAGGVWHPRQRTGFRFKKVFNIPENGDTTNVTARFENEMFYIIISKMRSPQQIMLTNISNQDNKSVPQVGESGTSFIEESKEIKDGKPSSSKSTHFLRDEKVENLGVAKSSATQDGEESSNKVDQTPRDKKAKNMEDVNFIATQDDKAPRNEHDQSTRDKSVETKGVVLSSTTQDDRSLNNRIDQGPRDEKVASQGVTRSGTNQYDKSSYDGIDQSPREVKTESPEVKKSNLAQDDQASSNKPNQSPRDKKAEISKVTPSSETNLGDERLKNLKVIKSSKNQDEIQMDTKLEAPNKLEDSAKNPSSKKEKVLDSNNPAKQFESMNSIPKEVETKVGDQHELKSVENVMAERNPPHYDHIQETKATSVHAKKEDNNSNGSPVEVDKVEEANSIWKSFPYFSQFILSRSELIFIASIIVFSLVLYIICTLTHSED